MVTLHWISTSANLLKVFVANRVAKIQSKTNIHKWKHIKSSDNPAGALSKGQLPSEFLKNNLFLYGPRFLLEKPENWPISINP